MTVGSHWPLTGPLTAEQRARMERTGLCMGCHQNMTDEEMWQAVATPGFVTNEEHQAVMDAALHSLAEDRGATVTDEPQPVDDPAEDPGAATDGHGGPEIVEPAQ